MVRVEQTNSQLVPVLPVTISVSEESSSTAFVPTHHLTRLVPTKIINVTGMTIYWFQRGFRGRTDPAVDCAMITIRQGVSTFDLSYYPTKDSPQIVQRLELTELGKAIEDLIGAGFPVSKTT